MRAGGSPLRMPMSAALSRSDTDFNRVLLLIKFILSLKISQQKIGDTSPHPRFNQSSQPFCFDVAHLNRQNFFFNSRDLQSYHLIKLSLMTILLNANICSLTIFGMR